MPFIVQKIAGKQSLIDVVAGRMLRIGRGTNADLRFDDVAVTLEHAVIESADGGYRLLDRGSVTGTYLNGKPVREARLAHGDLINIGGYRIRVQVTDPDDPLFLSVRPSAPMAQAAAAPATAAPPAATMPREPSGAVAAALAAATAAAGVAPRGPAREVVREPPREPPREMVRESATQLESEPAREPSGAAVDPGATVRLTAGEMARLVAAGEARAAAAARAEDEARAAVGPAAPLGPAGGTAAAGGTESPPAAGGAAGAGEASKEKTQGAPPPPSSALPSSALPQRPLPPPVQSPSSPRPPAQPPALRAPAVDYLGALGLRRAFFNKGLLALVLSLGAAVVALSLPSMGKATAFEPGRVRLAHADAACASCHTPWRGPDPALCSDCHARQREKGQIHEQRQVFTPPCTSCHPEHRGSDRVAAAGDATCASCHGDLQIKPPGAQPRFASHVHRFVDDHPDFSVTLPDGTRQPLADAVARRSDPTPLKFSHQRHLQPQLPTPSGRRVQLGCQDCHRLAAAPAGPTGSAAGGQTAPGGSGRQATAGGQGQEAGGQGREAGGATGMVTVTYAASCSGCHPLTFDSRRPDQVAPHAAPQRVREFLISVYSDKRGANESVLGQYRRLIRGAQSREIDYGGQAQGSEVLAESYLYRIACRQCHVVDTNVKGVPVVAWTPIPERWLPNARFSHLDHQASDCRVCHAGAAASTVAADVLLPPIAVCRTCHGGVVPAAAGTAQPRVGTAPAAPTDCLSCHRYHPDSPSPAQNALLPPAARATLMARAVVQPGGEARPLHSAGGPGGG